MGKASKIYTKRLIGEVAHDTLHFLICLVSDGPRA